MARIGDEQRGVTQMTPTAEELTSPQQPPIQSASEYARRTEGKRQALSTSKQQGRPLGGAPPIPAGKLAGLVPGGPPGGLPQPDFGEEPPAPGPDEELAFEAPPRPPPPRVGGVGSAYDINQAMARGEVARPVTLGAAKKMGPPQQAQQRGPLSEETVRLLEMQQSQQGGQAPSQQEAQPEEDTRQQRLDDSEREIAEANRLDVGDLPLEMIAQMRNDIIYDQRRRKALEARLQPLDISDLVTRREIQQHVPSVPGKVEYDLRTVNEQEHLFCLQYVYEFPGSARYVEELLNMCRLVCATIALNGRMLPDHRKHVGKLDEEVDKQAFEKKFKMVVLYPTHLVADLGAQYHWFVERVNKLFDVDTLKNG